MAAEEVKLDLAVSGEPSGWLERQKRRLRTAAHNVALFYVNRQARSQYRVNRQTSELLIALARQASKMEQAQQELVGRLEAQVAALQAKVQALREEAGQKRHED